MPSTMDSAMPEVAQEIGDGGERRHAADDVAAADAGLLDLHQADDRPLEVWAARTAGELEQVRAWLPGACLAAPWHAEAAERASG